LGANDKRCNSTWGLQIDHIEPFARGGRNTTNNLRLLCGKHNRFAAEKVYGKGFMEEHYQRE
jgi:5-methylcytosine-specific restriction endonuclease McrA